MDYTDSGAVNYGNVSPGVHVINGWTYSIVPGGAVTVGNSNGEDIGIQLGDDGGTSGHFEMTGGSFTSSETSSNSQSSPHGYGLLAYENSTFNISGGTFTATETQHGHNYIIQMWDSTTGTIGGTAMLVGTESAQGNGKGAELHDNASLTITGGSISHTSNDFNGSNMFILQDSSTLDISEGTFTLTSTAGNNKTVFQINDSSVVTMSGGEVASVMTSGERNLAQIHHDGQLILSGGKFPTGSDKLDLVFHNDSTADALVTLYGSDFMLDGMPIDYGYIDEVAGTLSGMLADGNFIEFDFDQKNTDTNQNPGETFVNRILLADPTAAAVPEPHSVAIWVFLGIVLSGTTLWRRHRRQNVAATVE